MNDQLVALFLSNWEEVCWGLLSMVDESMCVVSIRGRSLTWSPHLPPVDQYDFVCPVSLSQVLSFYLLRIVSCLCDLCLTPLCSDDTSVVPVTICITSEPPPEGDITLRIDTLAACYVSLIMFVLSPYRFVMSFLTVRCFLIVSKCEAITDIYYPINAD